MAKFYKHLRSTRIKSGIWTLAVLVILLMGYLWLTNRMDMKAQQSLRVLFTDVMGLETGDKIMYRGMEAGRVKTVTLYEEGILVSAKISRDIKIPLGSRFYIEDSLMGSKSLNIEPTNSRGFMDLSKVQHGEDPTGMMDMIAKAGSSLEKLDLILARLKEEGGLLDQGEGLIKDTGRTIRNANTGITRIKDDISLTLGKVDSLMMVVHSFVQESSPDLKETIALAPATMTKVNSALDSLATLSAKLNISAEAMAKGEGSAGKLLHEDELYDRLLHSIENLDSLIADIKENPRKYIKISVF